MSDASNKVTECHDDSSETSTTDTVSILCTVYDPEILQVMTRRKPDHCSSTGLHHTLQHKLTVEGKQQRLLISNLCDCFVLQYKNSTFFPQVSKAAECTMHKAGHYYIFQRCMKRGREPYPYIYYHASISMHHLPLWFMVRLCHRTMM